MEEYIDEIATRYGHIEDFPYSWWIHGNSGCEENRPPRISMYNIGDHYSKMKQQLSKSYLSKFREDRYSPEYVFLHTFAHLFIRQLTNECGYSSASIKEKIYFAFNTDGNEKFPMHGILVYLASFDCDGSLGGLISIADPLCITSTEQGYNSLNYSACHDCVLLPETSCESRNALLDRVFVVGTPDNPNLGLLGEYLFKL